MKSPIIKVITLIQKDNKILLLHKIKSNSWCLPGGKLEMFETLEECAAREVKEETNLEIVNLHFLKFVEFFDDKKHYIIFVYKSNEFKNKVKLTEPDKFSRIRWFYNDKLPVNIEYKKLLNI